MTHTTPDEVLAAEFVDGNREAAVEMSHRYAAFIRSVASQYGQFVAFDREDAAQAAFVSMLVAMREVSETGVEFRKLFMDKAREDLRQEADKYRAAVPVGLPTTMLRRVIAAVRLFGGDARAARDYLADAAPTGQRMARDTFDSVWLLAFGAHLEWSEPSGEKGLRVEETVADTTTDAFCDVDNRDAIERLLAMLTPGEREVMGRLYGLDGYPAALYDKKRDTFISATSAIVGTQMGMHAESIRRIHSRCLAKLQIHAEDL